MRTPDPDGGCREAFGDNVAYDGGVCCGCCGYCVGVEVADMVPRTELALEAGRLEDKAGDRRRFERFGLGDEMFVCEEEAGGNWGVPRVEGAIERIGEMAAEVDIMRVVCEKERESTRV